MSSILYSLQLEVADCLLADPFFANIPVLVEQPRDVGYELQRSSAAAATYGIVRVPQALVAAAGAPGPYFDPVEIAVRFCENVPVSTGPHALEVAETALALLHLYRPPTVNEVLTAAPVALKAVTVPDGVAYEIQVRTQAGAGYPVPQLAAPGVTAAGSTSPQTVGLSNAQAGAAIFYTVDGSQPAPRAPTAILYTGPFTVGAPLRLRARAWLAGYAASPEAQMEFN